MHSEIRWHATSYSVLSNEVVPSAVLHLAFPVMGQIKGGNIFGKDAETHGRRANGMHALPCSLAHIMRFRCYTITTSYNIFQPSQNRYNRG